MPQKPTAGQHSEGAQVPNIWIQVAPVPAGAAPQAVRSALKQISTEQLQAVGAVAAEVQAWLFKKLGEIKPRPSGVSLEFGIDAEGEAGIPFVTKGSIGANFKVTLEWK